MTADRADRVRTGGARRSRIQGQSSSRSTTASTTQASSWSTSGARRHFYGSVEDHARITRQTAPAFSAPIRPTTQLRSPHRGTAARRRSQRDEGPPRRGARPLGRTAASRQLRRGPNARRIPHRHQTARDHAGGGAEASTVDSCSVTWQNWCFVIGFQRPRRAHATRSLLRRRRQEPADPLPCIAFGDGRPLRRPGRAASPQGTRSTPANTALSACARTVSELGCDCLGHIKYFDGHLTTSRGEPLLIKNAICMHEEDFGILWKHTDRYGSTCRRCGSAAAAGRVVDRHGRELRVPGSSGISTRTATSEFEIKLTGILSARQPLHAGEKSKYGALIARAALRSQSPALFQRPPRPRHRRSCEFGLPGSTWCAPIQWGRRIRTRTPSPRSRRCSKPRNRPARI